MGQSSSSNSPFTVTKRIEQVTTTRSSERKDNQVSDNENVPTHRENIKFEERIDESFRGTAMRILNSKTKQDEELSAAQEQFLVECAMRFFNVDGSDKMVKNVFKKLLFPSLRVIDLPPLTIVFKEGDDGTNAYLVEGGELEVSDSNGVEYCLVGTGHVIGETSLLYDRERNATVTTITKTRLRSLDRSSFNAVQMALSKNAKLNQHAQRFLELGPVVDLPWSFQERVANQLTSVSYNRGKRICSQGACSTNTIVIERGVIHVHVPTSLLALAEPHRTILDTGRTTSTGWDINAVSSLPQELLRTMGISLPPKKNKDGANDNEDPISETSDDASVNSDNTQQTSSTNTTNHTTKKKGKTTTTIRAPSLLSMNSSSSKMNAKSNFDQMNTGKLHDSLTSNLRRSSSSIISNMDRSANGLSLLRQSQRSPSLTNSSSLPLNSSQRGLEDVMDRSITTITNGGIDDNASLSGRQINRRASSVTSISLARGGSTKSFLNPNTLPKIGTIESSNSTLLASSEKDFDRSRRSSVDSFSTTNGTLLNTSSKQKLAAVTSFSMPSTPNRSPAMTMRKTSLLSTAEQKQVIMSALSMSGKSDSKTDNKQSGSCKAIKEDHDSSDGSDMDSDEETGPLAPLRDVSHHRSMSQRSPTHMINTDFSPSTISGMVNVMADGPGRSKSVSHVSTSNGTVMMLSSPLSSSGKEFTASSSSEKNGGVKRMNSISRIPTSSTDSMSNGDEAKSTRHGLSKTPSNASLLSAKQGSSSSSSSSMVSPSQSHSSKYNTKSSSSSSSSSGGGGAIRRDSKLLFMSLVEKFVLPENETRQDEKDNGTGTVFEDMSSPSDSKHQNDNAATSTKNGMDLPIHLISSVLSTNIIPAAMDEQVVLAAAAALTTSPGLSSLDSSPRREDGHHHHHYHNGSNSAGGGGGQFTLQTKSPPPLLLSESERNLKANNRITPLESSPLTIGGTRAHHDVNAMVPMFPSSKEEQLLSLSLSSQEEEESNIIIALGPGCMIGKHCLDSLLNRPNAPEWKDEITQGTLNVGALSSITAVVPNDSSDRVQVMCLSSYGYQKAIGNTMSNNGFERQIPLAEVAQNLKDDYTSSYVLQGAYRPSVGAGGITTTFTMESFEDMKEIKRLADSIGEVMKARILSEALPDDRNEHNTGQSDSPDSSTASKFIRRDSFGGDRSVGTPGSSSSGKGWERSLSFQLIASLGMGSTDAPSTSSSPSPSVSPIMFKAAAAAVLFTDQSNTDRDCVLKIFRKEKLIDTNKVAAALRESSILSSPEVQQCPFIVRLIGKFQTSDAMVLVMDHVARRDLKTLMMDIKSDSIPREKRINSPYYYINQPPQLSLELVKYYTASVIAALSHLHNHRIIYRNLKPENVMIDKRGHVKLIDMSCAKILPFHDSHGMLHNRTYTICGLAEYICPEMIQRTGHNSAADSWQVGILLYEMLTGKTPFADAATEFRINANSGKKTVHRVSDGDAKILTSIAAVQFKGIQKILPIDICDSLNKVEGSLELVLDFLNTVPNNRLPLILNPTSAICKSPFFKIFDWKGLLAGTMYPPYTPPPIKAPVNTENITNRRLSFTHTPAVPTLPIKKETTTHPMENKNFMEATLASLSAIATNSTASMTTSSATTTTTTSSSSNNSKNKQHMGHGKQQLSGRAGAGGNKSMTIDTTTTTETPRSKQHVDHDHQHQQNNNHHQVFDQTMFDGF